MPQQMDFKTKLRKLFVVLLVLSWQTGIEQTLNAERTEQEGKREDKQEQCYVSSFEKMALIFLSPHKAEFNTSKQNPK